MSRDRASTARAILAAAHELLLAHGPESCGINAVALLSGYDKVLIYRYFGGHDGLLNSLAKEVVFFPAEPELPEAGSSPKVLEAAYEGVLRDQRAAQVLWRWELVLAEDNPLRQVFLEQRSRFEQQLLQRAAPSPEGEPATRLLPYLREAVAGLLRRTPPPQAPTAPLLPARKKRVIRRKGSTRRETRRGPKDAGKGKQTRKPAGGAEREGSAKPAPQTRSSGWEDLPVELL